MRTHPSPWDLALYAGRDLGLWQRMRMAAHLLRCSACRDEAASLRAAREQVRERSHQLPANLDWDRLSREMRANIRLGLTAGALVENAREDQFLEEPAGWRLAVVLGSVAFVALAGWLLQAPRPAGPQTPEMSRIVLDARPDGVAVEQQGATLTLLNPEKQTVTTTVGWDGSARASFLDDATGQVTIHNVSAQ